MKFLVIPIFTIVTSLVAQVPLVISPSVDLSKTGFTFSGIPDSLNVSVDDSARGITPLTLKNITPGEHSIVFTKKGFYGKKITATAIKDSLVAIKEELRAPASLTVISSPDSAILFINKKKMDKTPFTVTPLRPESYSIMLLKAGYNQFDTTLTLESGKADTLRLTLIPQVSQTIANAEKVAVTPTVNSKPETTKVELTDREKTRRNHITVIASAIVATFLTILFVSESNGNK